MDARGHGRFLIGNIPLEGASYRLVTGRCDFFSRHVVDPRRRHSTTWRTPTAATGGDPHEALRLSHFTEQQARPGLRRRARPAARRAEPRLRRRRAARARVSRAQPDGQGPHASPTATSRSGSRPPSSATSAPRVPVRCGPSTRARKRTCCSGSSSPSCHLDPYFTTPRRRAPHQGAPRRSRRRGARRRRARPSCGRFLAIVEGQLTGRDYLTGTFTVADIAAGCTVELASLVLARPRAVSEHARLAGAARCARVVAQPAAPAIAA